MGIRNEKHTLRREEVKRMKTKQLLVVALTFALGVGLAANALAELPERKPFTASADLSGTAATDWTVTLKELDGSNTAETQIGWSGVNAGDAVWKVADLCLEVDADVTLVDWGIQIYTDNKNDATSTPTANPEYTGGTDEGGYSLIGTVNPASTLPMCWKVTDVSTAVPNIPVFSLDRGDGSEGFTDYQWKWLKDHSQTGTNAWGNNEPYSVVWDDEGVRTDGDGTEVFACPSPNYIYFATDFTGSTAQEYKTNKLILELYSL